VQMNQAYGAPPPRPHVRFEMRAVETRADGKVAFEDKAWAIVSAPGSRDTTERLVEDWLGMLEEHGRAGRVPGVWPQEYRDAYASWVKTQEQPSHGTSLKQWPGITPGQLKACQSANVRTIEELADANAEMLGRIGMGAVSLKASAMAWLKEQKTGGSMALEIQSLTNRLNEALGLIEELKGRLPDSPKKG